MSSIQTEKTTLPTHEKKGGKGTKLGTTTTTGMQGMTSTTGTEKCGGTEKCEKGTCDHAEKMATTTGSRMRSDCANKGVVFCGEGKVEVKSIPYPKMEFPWNKQPCNNGVIVKVLTAGVCGTDMHPFHGRSPVKTGTVLGHEFTGEIVECGSAVEHLKVGDWGMISCNISCGTCSNCKAQRSELCERSNPEQKKEGQGGLYGYLGCGNWQGGQAQYAFVPWADFNFLKFPCDKTLAKDKLLDLTLLTDVFPTAMHGVVGAHVDVGSTVFIAGAGPIGLAALLCCNLKGAACVFVADHIPERLELARRSGGIPINLSEMKGDTGVCDVIKGKLNGCCFVDCAVECVGFEAKSTGTSDENVCCSALATIAEVIKPGGHVGVLGLYPMMDPKAPSTEEKQGVYTFPFGKFWQKGCSLSTGPVIVSRYSEWLMRMILHDKLTIARALNVKVFPLDQAATAYKEMSDKKPHKMIFDPHNLFGSSTGTDLATGTA